MTKNLILKIPEFEDIQKNIFSPSDWFIKQHLKYSESKYLEIYNLTAIQFDKKYDTEIFKEGDSFSNNISSQNLFTIKRIFTISIVRGIVLSNIESKNLDNFYGDVFYKSLTEKLEELYTLLPAGKYKKLKSAK